MINKNEIYSEMTNLVAKLSKDQNTHIGAVIIGVNGEPISWGYNGTIAGFPDEYIPHSRDEKELQYMEGDEVITIISNKYPFMCHGESNAIFYADKSKLIGATLYVNAMPCKLCAKEIARAKIACVFVNNGVTINGGTLGIDDSITKFIFATAGIKLVIDGVDKKLCNIVEKH